LYRALGHEKLHLFGKPIRKRPIGRHRHRSEDNIKIDLESIGYQDLDLIHRN
jgi:hypothetical protein